MGCECKVWRFTCPPGHKTPDVQDWINRWVEANQKHVFFFLEKEKKTVKDNGKEGDVSCVGVFYSTLTLCVSGPPREPAYGVMCFLIGILATQRSSNGVTPSSLTLRGQPPEV